MISLTNEKIRIDFSEDTGAIIRIEDRMRGVVLCRGDGASPFELDTGNGRSPAFSAFAHHMESGPHVERACRMVWTLASGTRVHARVELKNGSDELRFTSYVENCGGETLYTLKYPILGGIGAITPDGNEDYLVHSYATGVCVHNPLVNFPAEGDGFVQMPYPESFSGCSMQFLAYYGLGRAGLYAAAYDPCGRAKWLNFCRHGRALELSHVYGFQNITPGSGLSAEYPFVIRTLSGNGWYEAAELYKAWAIRQPWCRMGPLAGRDKRLRPSWLFEKVGLATFGINACHDRTKWLRAYRRLAGTPVFHVSGPDWPRSTQDYQGHYCGGYDDWFPVRMEPENRRVIREQGDYFAPFEFDSVVNSAGTDAEEIANNLIVYPASPLSMDSYSFHILCPCTEYTRALHVRRDTELVRETDCDAIYYDISANNLLHICLAPGHGHAVGGSGEVSRAFHDTYVATKKAACREAGRYVPLGTEMINEIFLDTLDFYQARAWAQPGSILETWAFRSLMKSGEMTMIPLFTYVYHEYGVQRLDGWGKLTAEVGELFYHTVAKVYLWGGLFELNCEYSPMEAIGGEENSASEHYFPFRGEGFALDEERAAYLSQFAALRTGLGNPYLAYGRMLPPPRFENAPHSYSWMLYNAIPGSPEYHDAGVFNIGSVVASAWRAPGGPNAPVGILFANATDDRKIIDIPIRLEEYGLLSPCEGKLSSGFGKERLDSRECGLFRPGEEGHLSVILAPRQVALLELTHAEPGVSQ